MTAWHHILCFVFYASDGTISLSLKVSHEKLFTLHVEEED